MYTMKNNGPNKEPCRIPKVTVSQSEASPFTTKRCLQWSWSKFPECKADYKRGECLLIAF